ncbi:DUF4124 domain-containing protein [Rheinheimera sp.]|uniref:DUF4124 domain-containing protein n=1 Tax=Rheinheimera sp. TaxID=1869214 RepID=UPI002FDD19EB
MKTMFLLVLSLWFCCDLLAAEQVMYQWRDKNNTLHVSQLPPQNVEYETVVIGPAQQTTAIKPQKKTTEQQQARLASCEKARKNLKILQQDLPVFIDMEDGSRQQLTDVQMDAQRTLAEQQIHLFCDDPAKH